MKLSVLDFATPKEAFDRARDGDRIYFPGRYVGYEAPPGGFKINRSIEVYGDGMCDNGAPTGSVVYGDRQETPPDPPTYGDAFLVDVPTGSVPMGPVYFHDFKVSACQNGILCQLASAQKKLQSLTADRVNVFNATEHGFRLEGFSSANRIESMGITACVASISVGMGLRLKHLRSARVVRSTFIDNHLHAIRAESCSMALYNTGCDNTAHLGDPPPAGQYAIEEQMLFSSCIAVVVDACVFESFQKINATPPGAGVGCRFLSTKVAQIGGSFFYTGGSTPTITGVLAEGAGSGPVVVLPNRFERVAGWMVNVEDTVLGCVILAQFDHKNQPTHSGAIHVPAASGGNGGCVGVPLERRPSDPFDTNRGLIVPSGTAAASNLQDGMLYLATSTGKLMGRIGAQWKTIQTD